MSGVKIKKISYAGWDNCIQVTNGIVDCIITVDVGPRIIRYGFAEQVNEMCEVESTLGLKGGRQWRIYGGHRLWHSPEDRQRTYAPDNSPVTWEEISNGVKTIQDTEAGTNIKKEMEITLSPENSAVMVLHRLTNKGPCPVELSVWSISAMAPGGKEIVPQPTRDTGLLPNRVLVLWPYTKMNDHRIHFGEKYIHLQQDPDMKPPLKFGISNEHGWAAYFNNNHLFVKHYEHIEKSRYPDFGVSYETYTNDFMLEMETLSPLTVLGPESSAAHGETWELFDSVSMPSDDEREIEQALKDRVPGIKRTGTY